MKKLLISAAALALLAAPAAAQPDHGRVGKAAMAPQVQDQAQRQLQAQAGRPGPNGLVMAPPGALPLGTDGKPVRLDNNRPGIPPNPGQAQRQDDRRGNDARGNNDRRGDYRGNDNRGRDNNNFGNRGNDNRGGWNGGNRGPRRDYSGFRNYHQNFRSSRRFHAPAYRRPPGWTYQRWSFGQILPALFWGQQYWLNNYVSYDLPPPPYGAVWVRYGNDALLVDRDTGEIITVEYDVFY